MCRWAATCGMAVLRSCMPKRLAQGQQGSKLSHDINFPDSSVLGGCRDTPGTAEALSAASPAGRSSRPSTPELPKVGVFICPSTEAMSPPGPAFQQSAGLRKSRGARSSCRARKARSLGSNSLRFAIMAGMTFESTRPLFHMVMSSW